MNREMRERLARSDDGETIERTTEQIRQEQEMVDQLKKVWDENGGIEKILQGLNISDQDSITEAWKASVK